MELKANKNIEDIVAKNKAKAAEQRIAADSNTLLKNALLNSKAQLDEKRKNKESRQLLQKGLLEEIKSKVDEIPARDHSPVSKKKNIDRPVQQNNQEEITLELTQDEKEQLARTMGYIEASLEHKSPDAKSNSLIQDYVDGLHKNCENILKEYDRPNRSYESVVQKIEDFQKWHDGKIKEIESIDSSLSKKISTIAKYVIKSFSPLKSHRQDAKKVRKDIDKMFKKDKILEKMKKNKNIFGKFTKKFKNTKNYPKPSPSRG